MFERQPEQNLRYPLLLIHGLFSSSRTWRKTVADFTATYDLRYGGEVSAAPVAGGVNPQAGDFYTLTFSNNRNLSYRDQAREIRHAVDAIKKLNGADKVVLAGHSMGGLAARAFIQLLGAKDVYALITLGTPHYGSPLALLRDSTQANAQKIFSRLGKALAGSGSDGEKRPGFFRRLLMRLLSVTSETEAEINRFFSSEAFTELMPGSAALEELNALALPADLKYVFIVGSVTNFSAYRRDEETKAGSRLTAFWTRTTERAAQTMGKRYLSAANEAFRNYIARYFPHSQKIAEQQWLDFDGAVPVLSQVLHHFKREPGQRAVLPVFASHTKLTSQSAKIFQALALCGAVGANDRHR